MYIHIHIYIHIYTHIIQDECARIRDGLRSGGDSPLINAIMYGATGLGLYWLSKNAGEEQSKNVGVKADETTFDHSITFDDIAGIDDSKVHTCMATAACIDACMCYLCM
jgi:hypothetical protein